MRTINIANVYGGFFMLQYVNVVKICLALLIRFQFILIQYTLK